MIAKYLIFLTSILIILLGSFVFFKNRNSSVNKSFFFFTLAVFLWLFFYSLAYFSPNKDISYQLFQIGYLGVFFIPTTWLHFTFKFLQKNYKQFIFLLYLCSFTFALIQKAFGLFIYGFREYSWGIYPQAAIPYHLVFLTYFISMFSVSMTFLFWEFFFKAKIHDQLQVLRIKYVFWGTVIGSLAAVDFLPNYGFASFPFGFVFMLSFIIMTAFAIIKYRFLDLTLVFTRTGIFVAVYSLVLGVPFAIAFSGRGKLEYFLGDNWWLIPMVSLTVLATSGPFLYLYIQKRAEEQLLKEQRRYQATLSQASSGMGRIKDLKRLLELVVYIITRAVRLENTLVYIYDTHRSKYLIGAFKGNIAVSDSSTIAASSPLVQYLIKIKTSIVYDEIKQRVQDYNDENLAKVEKEMSELNAALVVPSLIEDRLLAILVLGKKKSGKLFGEDDLSVFSILANQAALAIENAQFYEDVKKTQEQLFQAEKMATIGTMADGLSHQINNRLHALGFIAGDALDTIKMKKNAQMSDEMKEVMTDLERSLVRIQENVLQGGEVVQGLLRYTRKGEQGYAPVEVDKLVTAAVEMAQFKIKTHEMKILREYDKNGPKIKGNFTQLQEVFFNMIDNAYDAMMQRKNEQKETGFHPTLRIQTFIDGDRIIIKFIDNGIGVKSEDFQKIFTPFFTTKLSSKKGTGLGLYVIKKIIEENHKGKVTFESHYLQGTTMVLNLPVAY